ncbi:hypothetical protein V3C99_001369 [Haemonchus contortus]
MDEESRQLLTINTRRGLYRLNFLSFGVEAVLDIFHQQTDTLTAGMDGTLAYIDDIIVAGKTAQLSPKGSFQTNSTFGFLLRLEECSHQNPLFRLHNRRQRPDPTKIEAIQTMPVPKDVSQLRASQIDQLLRICP